MSSLLARTYSRIEKIKHLKPGYRIEVMWEHTWAKLKIENESLKTFIKQNQFYEPLRARDALYGGECLEISYQLSFQ
jgi:hypothetical protein